MSYRLEDFPDPAFFEDDPTPSGKGTSSATADADPSAATEPKFRLDVLTSSFLAGLPDPDESDLLLGPLLIKGGRTIVVGDTGHGKTTFALAMASAVLRRKNFLDYEGTGEGPILIVDLEQGIRSIKRGILDAGLEKTDAALYVAQPDGLSLGDEPAHLEELYRIVDEYRPIVVVIDPFYKAHRGDPNDEKPVVLLMRLLDALRAQFGFALILPAHPRKNIVAAEGVRKLTIHDVAGSGAIVRGAEVVLGLERVSHGYARLRILKDRDGDLPVGEAWPLIYDRENGGFRLDPKEKLKAEDIETLIRKTEPGWMTITEWGKHLGIRREKAREVLERLRESGEVVYSDTPSGRRPNTKAFTTCPAPPDKSGQVGLESCL